ncbi:MAG: DUF192 domain-containing protein [Deltaproteobacteria bacterium]|nr:DUF192 domain-containing protein [Candidatus Zymogenaceae bacterium]
MFYIINRTIIAVVLLGIVASFPSSCFGLETVRLRVGDVEITAEVADNSSERSVGLMFRKEMADDHGMLFVYDLPRQLGFWMKNTYIPLSIAFIDASGTIVSIQDMQPLDDTTIHRSPKPVVWALEMNQGWFAENGVDVGDTVRLME